MSDMNVVVIGGRLCDKPELRFLPDGKAVADARIANNRQTGGGKERAIFIKVNAFGKLAESFAEHKKKGDEILAHGVLCSNKWTDKSGNERTEIYITANEIQFLRNAKREAGDETTGEQSERPARSATATQKAAPKDEDLPF